MGWPHFGAAPTLGSVDSTSWSLRVLGGSSTSGEILWTTSFSKSKTLSWRLSLVPALEWAYQLCGSCTLMGLPPTCCVSHF